MNHFFIFLGQLNDLLQLLTVIANFLGILFPIKVEGGSYFFDIDFNLFLYYLNLFYSV